VRIDLRFLSSPPRENLWRVYIYINVDIGRMDGQGSRWVDDLYQLAFRMHNDIARRTTHARRLHPMACSVGPQARISSAVRRRERDQDCAALRSRSLHVSCCLPTVPPSNPFAPLFRPLPFSPPPACVSSVPDRRIALPAEATYTLCQAQVSRSFGEKQKSYWVTDSPIYTLIFYFFIFLFFYFFCCVE